MSEKDTNEPSLHDWLSLGEIERALSTNKTHRNEDDLWRLPLLLRLLAASQPLASVPHILGNEEFETNKNNQNNKQSPTSSSPLPDSVVNEVVSRLEEVAATYSTAEGVDALVSYLAPSVTRKIGKLPPLKRMYSSKGQMRKRAWDGMWDTKELAAVAAAPVVGTGSRKRKRKKSFVPRGDDTGDENLVGEEEDDEDMDDMEDTLDVTFPRGASKSKDSKKSTATTSSSSVGVDATNNNNNNNNNEGGSESFLVGAAVVAEDSQESMIIQTLSEVASLVVASLEPISQSQDEDGEKHKGHVALPIMSDSLLLDSVGATGGTSSDLGATLAGLMHHSPVLRHQHVANALCRVATPQAPDLIARMAANCPTISPCLVRGCLDAYQSACAVSTTNSQVHNHPILSTATTAVRAVAHLSTRESARIVATLQQSDCTMIDLQLELTLPDAPSAALLVIEHLSNPKSDSEPNVTSHQSGQPAADSMNDSRSHRMLNIHNTAHMPSLVSRLKENHDLVGRTCECFLGELESISKDKSSRIIWGRVALLLRAYSLIVLRLGPALHNSKNKTLHDGKLHVTFCSAFDAILARMPTSAKPDVPSPTESRVDQLFQTLFCASFVTYCRFPQTTEAGESSSENDDPLRTCFAKMMTLSSISLRSDVYMACVASFLKSKSASAIFELVVNSLCSKSSSRQPLGSMDRDFESGLQNLLEWAQQLKELDPAICRGTSAPAILEDTTALVESMVNNTVALSHVNEVLKDILANPSKCKSIMIKSGAPDLIEGSVVMLLNDDAGPKLPLVLPVKLEAIGGKVVWPRCSSGVGSLSDEGYQFLFKLLYSLCFLELQPESPFVVDLTNLPLAETMFVCDAWSDSNIPPRLQTFAKVLKVSLRKHCPDVVPHVMGPPNSSFRVPNSVATLRGDINHRKTLQMVSNTIRCCIGDDKHSENSGAAAERTFLLARSRICSKDVDTAAVRALLTSKNSPSPYFSYANICRDPLVLLKCPLSAWKCRGLRRIILSILNRALDANDHLVLETSPTEDTAFELVAARNAIIVRCLLVATSGATSSLTENPTKKGARPLYCSMMMSTIRSLVVRQRGLTALLVRQGLPDIAVDWLVEFVPESINDASTLKSLLSERSSLTAAERLTAADASLRVAIVHGSADNEHAQALTYAALSVMVSSFFLVIGPVGVPVNCVLEDDGPDVTQLCRKAFFRMLAALQKVNGRNPGVRNECTIALQKIAGLCKGENVMSGVAGVVAARRKKLLKEIWDAVVKANNAMGCGAQI